MQKNNRKVLDSLVSKTKIYLAIIFILLVVICIENIYMILPSTCIFVAILLYSYYTNNKRKSELSETLQDLTLTVDSTAKTSLINSPFPLVILETDGNVVWKSSKFTSEFANIDIHTYIKELSMEIKDEIEKRKEPKDLARCSQISAQSGTPDSVQCARLNSGEHAALGKIWRHKAIIHRTVR